MAHVSTATRRTQQRARQHGAGLEPVERRTLERSGWRTMLDYRENHVRGLDGRLLRVEPVWVAEAERYDGQLAFASASGVTPSEAWMALLDAVEEGRIAVSHRVRLAAARLTS
jgi:hypothetical protein